MELSLLNVLQASSEKTINHQEDCYQVNQIYFQEFIVRICINKHTIWYIPDNSNSEDFLSRNTINTILPENQSILQNAEKYNNVISQQVIY